MNFNLLRKIVNEHNDEDLERFIGFINTAGFLEGVGNFAYIPDDELIEEAENFMNSKYELTRDYLENKILF